MPGSAYTYPPNPKSVSINMLWYFLSSSEYTNSYPGNLFLSFVPSVLSPVARSVYTSAGFLSLPNIILVVSEFVVLLTGIPARSANICLAVKSPLQWLNTASVAITSLSQYSATSFQRSSGTGLSQGKPSS